MSFPLVLYLKSIRRWYPDCFVSKLLALLFCMLSFCLTSVAQYDHKNTILHNDTVAIYNRFKKIEKEVQEGRISIDSSISVYQDLLDLSRKAHYKRAILVALRRLGDDYGNKGEWDKAAALLQEAIQIVRQNKEHQPGLAPLYSNFAIVQLRANKLDSAAYYFLKAAALSSAEGNKYAAATSYNNVSEVFRLLKAEEKQLEYLHKALAISLALDKETGPHRAPIKEKPQPKDSTYRFKLAELKGKIYRNLGDFYVHMEQEDSVTSGIAYLAQALKLARQYPMPDLEEGVFTSIAVYHMDQQQYDQAITYFEKAIAIKVPEGGPNMGFQYAKLGECYFLLKEYKKAATLLEQAIQEADKYKVSTELANYYVTLARVYEAMGQYQQAVKYYSLNVDAKDSIDRTEMANAVFGLQYQFETAQKDNEILSNRLKISQQQAMIERNRMILLSISLVVLLAGVSSGLYLRYRRRLHRQSEQQALEIAAWRASMDGEEKERRRLAKELHDNIGGNLSTLKMWLGNIWDDNSNGLSNSEQDYTGALHLLDHTLMEVRNTAHHLMPELLLRLGLAEAIRVYCNDIQRATGIKVNYQYLGYIGGLDDNIELLIYRTVQELVQNVVKHAKADYLLVQLSQFDKTLSITIEDNGQGMNTTAALQHQGMGLSSIKDSIAKLNGNFNIHSENGNGTTIEIEINAENNVLNNTTFTYDN